MQDLHRVRTAQHGTGEDSPSPTSVRGALGNCWLLEERESVFFRDVTPEELPTLQWMTVHACAHTGSTNAQSVKVTKQHLKSGGGKHSGGLEEELEGRDRVGLI